MESSIPRKNSLSQKPDRGSRRAALPLFARMEQCDEQKLAETAIAL